MAGESQATPESVPDPTVLTTDALARANKCERDYVDGQIAFVLAHIARIDKATEVLHETVTHTPTEIQTQVQAVRELLVTELKVLEAQVAGTREVQQQRKESIDRLFEHLDKVRSEDKREARALVDLALAAQKEMTSTALQSANKAIDKAQENTDKRYDTLDKAVQEIRVAMASMMPRKESEARHSAHEAAVSALISRTTAIEATKVGGQEQSSLNRGSNTAVVAAVSVAVAIVVMMLLAASFFIPKPS